jgi:hypothetical protein
MARNQHSKSRHCALAALAIVLLACGRSEAASCRDYATTAARTIKPRVEALRLVEREAADRTRGLDTRPYPYLAGQARAVADAIGEARALQEEDDLDKCAEAVPRVRRVCASAARALAGVLEEQNAGTVSQMSRQIYAQAMAVCEGLTTLAPLRTPFRASE